MHCLYHVTFVVGKPEIDIELLKRHTEYGANIYAVCCMVFLRFHRFTFVYKDGGGIRYLSNHFGLPGTFCVSVSLDNSVE